MRSDSDEDNELLESDKKLNMTADTGQYLAGKDNLT